MRLEAEFFLNPWYHARHLQQIHWFKIFCRMHVVMPTMPRSSPMSLINKIVMVALCRIRTPEAYKEANELFADEFHTVT